MPFGDTFSGVEPKLSDRCGVADELAGTFRYLQIHATVFPPTEQRFPSNLCVVSRTFPGGICGGTEIDGAGPGNPHCGGI